jgi:hypothetical protein
VWHEKRTGARQRVFSRLSVKEGYIFEVLGAHGNIKFEYVLQTLAGGVQWIDLAQGTERLGSVGSTVILYQVPSNCGSVGARLGTVGLSRRTLLHAVNLLVNMFLTEVNVR